MIKILALLALNILFIQNTDGFKTNFSVKASQIINKVLEKYKNKELELGSGCTLQLNELLENLISFDDGLWAYKMIDASGKVPAGLGEGNFIMMGNFDECLDVKSEKKNITGNYCSITIDVSSFMGQLESAKSFELLARYKKLLDESQQGASIQTIASTPMYGICVPNQCSAYDVQNALSAITSYIPLGVTCQTKDDVIPPLDTGAIVTIALLGVVICVMVTSTLIDYICQAKEVKAHPILISFSVYTNGKKLFKIRSGQSDLGCLHGIRFLSMCWVILGHVYVINLLGPHVNLFDVIEFTDKVQSMFFLNIQHAVDTFFVLSGLLVSYNFMKKMKKGEKFNIFTYYMHRYLRLTPPYAVIILCTVYLWKYLATGPLYFSTDGFLAEQCRNNWWSALLYLQNYVAKSSALCLSQSWNLSIDYQLYLISPLLLFFLYKTPRFGTLVTLISISGFMVAGYVITYQKKLSSLIMVRWAKNVIKLNTNYIHDTNRMKNSEFMEYYYVKTHTRSATWFIGAYLGYVLGRIRLFNDRSYLKTPRILVLLIWLVVLAVIPVCIFGFHDVLKSQNYDVTANSFYNSFARPIWALCVSWIIFACTIGYGGIINDFLSLPIFGVLSKFTYSIYLLHLGILYIMISSRKIPAYFSVPGLLNQFCTLFAVSFVVAIFWILAFEMPILVIEPYIFGKPGTTSKRNRQVFNDEMENGGNIERTYKNEVHLKVKNKITRNGHTVKIQP